MTWTLDYTRWDNDAIQTVTQIGGVVLALLSLGLVVWQLNQIREQIWIAAFEQCEESFSELQQMLFSDPDVAADYIRINNPILPDLAGTDKINRPRESNKSTALSEAVTKSDVPLAAAGQKDARANKLFIFYETYYGHMARVHALTHRKATRTEGQEYWKVYDKFLRVLCRSEHFRQVHVTSQKHESFEEAFINYVEDLIKNQATTRR